MPTKKLIEVALPLDDINVASAKEKSIRHGHPSTLHLWWARRPLAACRAVLFASLVDDPDQEGVPTELLAEIDRLPAPELPDWRELPLAEQRRQRLFRFIKKLVQWENSNDETTLATARSLIHAATGGNPPPVYDPFAGGGSIPLEAQRLGLEAHATDLNPVAVLINKALIEIPPKFAGMPPVNPVDRNQIGTQWKGAAGLAADIRYYGKWIRDEAEKRIGHLYSKAKLPKEYGGGEATVIAWLWARTVICPNPACGAKMPLMRSFLLSKKKGSEAWIRPVPSSLDRRVSFEIVYGKGAPSEGTVSRKGAYCVSCGSPASLDYVRSEAQAKRMDAVMTAMVVEAGGKRIYLAPHVDHESVANQVEPLWGSEEELSRHPQYMAAPRYGMTRHRDLFTNRQLTTLSTYSGLVAEAIERIAKDSTSEYASAIGAYLAFAVDKSATTNSSLCSWQTEPTRLVAAFGRQVIPIVWDYAEANPFSGAAGDYKLGINSVTEVLDRLVVGPIGAVAQLNAAEISALDTYLISTDPPYYDNVPYADLADFFYIWLRKTLSGQYADIFRTLLTPKAQELVADQERHGGRDKAKQYFEEGLNRVFAKIRRAQDAQYPLTIYYAFRQAEDDAETTEEDRRSDKVASTGWETILEAVINTGFLINGTWPIRTELQGALKTTRNALATSIVLVCRPRPDDARSTTRLEFIRALRRELPTALRALQRANIAPVDLAQAAIGPGMAIYSRYKAVLEADGSAMRVRTALQLINQALDEVLAEQEGEYDGDTRWAIAWFEQSAFDEGYYGIAETLSKAKNTSVAGLVEAGVVAARSGKVRLISRDELPANWNPAKDSRVTAWEATQHLVRALDKSGESGAAAILAALPGSVADQARDLAYRLYTTCERKKWAQEALAYNSLVIAWPEIAKLAVQRAEDGGPVQGRMEL
mgnify:CR=1 FL=1